MSDHNRRMLKAPLLIPQAYIFSVLKFKCRTYNATVRPFFQNPRFASLGALQFIGHGQHCRPFYCYFELFQTYF